MDIKNQLNSIFENLTQQVQEQVTNEIVVAVMRQIATMDFKSMVADQIKELIKDKANKLSFPDGSIPASAVNLTNFTISGDAIDGGVIKNFGSTGIEDKASKCQVTILDTHLVVESPILTTGIDVRGDAKIDGNLSITGVIDKDTNAFKALVSDTVAEVQQTINDDLFQKYNTSIYELIRKRGVEFTEVSINNKSVLTETKLGPSVVWSNLQRVGELEELQVRGETLLGRTLYAANKRIGINTIEPSSALTIWDEEIEIVAGKKKQNCGFIGTNRQTVLVLGTGGKENIQLDVDGSVTVSDLRLGAVSLSTASAEPSWDGITGEIVFNDSPGVDKPIGWVCLEGHRWGKFGIIQE